MCMAKIAITGGIGSGKSSVLNWLKSKGYFSIDADTLVHDALKEEETISELTSFFGSVILSKDRQIDRSILRKLVFLDREAPHNRKFLESIIHPKIRMKLLNICNYIDTICPGVWIFYEAALVIETELYKSFDCVILVQADHTKKVERLKRRSQLSEAESTRIIKSQLSDAEKAIYSDIIIENNQDIQGLINKLENLPNQITATLSSKKRMPTAV